jgi:hypothetical protein
MAIVGHSRNLKTLIGTKYDEEGEPTDSIFLKNCEIKELDENHFSL